MKKSILLFLSVVCLNISAKEAVSVNVQAESAYKNKDYTTATALYQSLLKDDSISAEVCYNLGNCYYRQNQIAMAILYYERALLVEPGMADARENLIIANGKKQDKIDEIERFFLLRWVDKISDIASSDSWAVISLVCFVLSLIFLIGYFFAKNIIIRKVGFYGAILLVFMFVVAVSLSYKQKCRLLDRDFAIIMSPSVTVKSTPDDNGTSLFVVHEGTKVQIQSELDNWIEVKLSNGSMGWILAIDIERI